MHLSRDILSRKLKLIIIMRVRTLQTHAELLYGPKCMTIFIKFFSIIFHPTIIHATSSLPLRTYLYSKSISLLFPYFLFLYIFFLFFESKNKTFVEKMHCFRTGRLSDGNECNRSCDLLHRLRHGGRHDHQQNVLWTRLLRWNYLQGRFLRYTLEYIKKLCDNFAGIFIIQNTMVRGEGEMVAGEKIKKEDIGGKI